MQKKNYSLFFVPCSLALCLALFFLMSCDSGGGTKNDPPSSSSAKTQPTYSSGSNGDIVFKTIEVKFTGAKAEVWGQVELTEGYNDTRFISSILIEMWDQEKGGSKKIAEKSFENVKVVDLRGDLQQSNNDLANVCTLQKVFVVVSLGGCEDPKDPSCAPNNTSTDVFKNPTAACASSDLTVKITPAGSGSVSKDPPQGPYSTGTDVKLTASASGGSVFFNWAVDGEYKTDKTITVKVAGSGNDITAVFVPSRNLGKKTTSELHEGDMLKSGSTNIASFDGSKDGSKFVASSNFKLINQFQLPKWQLDSPLNKQEVSDKEIPTPTATGQFIPAVNSEVNEIEFSVEVYLVAKAGSDWYLLYTKSCGNKCATVDIWKAQ